MIAKPSTLTTTTMTDSAPRIQALQLLAEISTRRAALKEVLAPFETQIAALQRACLVATADEVTAIEQLEHELKNLALAETHAVFGGDARTLQHGLLSLGVRQADKVEIIGDEDECISALQLAAKSKDAGTRVAACACLRITTEINKVFVRENWELSSPWFSSFGLTVKEVTSVSLTEKKPTKLKPSKAEEVKPAQALS